MALLLNQLRITVDKQLPKMDFLFQLFGKPCFPRRELVAVTGKAKSGKTFVTSMLIACCVIRDVLQFHRSSEMPLKILWYDTEQSDESTQDILKNRIRMMTQDNLQGIEVLNVRSVSWKDRRQLLLEAVSHYGPDLVIVDGIRDLVNDINDGVLAQEVMEELMHLADDKKCCIVCILHQNKGSEDHNLRGWIGTELMNKAFEVYACEKLMPQRIFKVEQTLTRKYDIEQTLYFEVDPEGLPRLTAVPMESGSESKSERLPNLNREYIVNEDDGSWRIDTKRLFLDAFNGSEELSGSEMRSRVMQLSGISVPYFYNRVLNEAVDSGHVLRSTNGHLTIYHPAPF
jgi:KaiC/GvpD/RAD55 family RecA-like ATPase